MNNKAVDFLTARDQEYWKDIFKDHVRTEVDGWTHWRKPDTSIYFMAMIIKHGYLVVVGDLYEAVYWWSQPVTFDWIAGCNLHYFCSKCRASPTGRTGKEWCKYHATEVLTGILKDSEEEENQLDPELKKEALSSLDYEDEWIDFLKSGRADELLGQDLWEFGDIGYVPSMEVCGHFYGIKAMVASNA